MITDPNPEWHLIYQTYLLSLVIPGISLVVAGLLLLQAPTSVGELINTALAQWPDPPRHIDRWLIWRVAWGYFTWPAYVLWTFLYFASLFFLFFSASQNSRAPIFLVSTFALAFGVTVVVAPSYLSILVRTSNRETIVAQRIELPSSSGRRAIRVWYQRPDGRLAKKDLGLEWNGHIKEGDQLDALTNKNGTILRLLSTPPAQA